MKYAVANWKMSPSSVEKAEELFAGIRQAVRTTKDVEVIICPPFPWLTLGENARSLGAKFSLGAQDLFWEAQGAHTGEVSAAMLQALHVSHVIIGHSERRALGETNEIVAKKLRAALDAGLKIILCVGEVNREGDWDAVLREEIESAFAVVQPDEIKQLLMAYEPVWAIGASKPDTPDDALSSALLIRKIGRQIFKDAGAKLPVLYGGSVSVETVGPFAMQEGIDGVLVGRASLDNKSFLSIVQALAAK